MKNRSKIVAAFVLLTALFLAAIVYTSKAQTYVTNSSSPYFGAAQYNGSFANPTAPSVTLAKQYSAGICAGVYSNTTAYFTNTFSTNVVYSTPPAVFVQQFGTPTIVQTNVVTSITTTNCIVWFGGATSVNFSLTSIGH